VPHTYEYIPIALIIAAFALVITPFGLFWHIDFRNVSGSHTYVFSVSLEMMAHAKTVLFR
jgi:hypothetical protein